MPSTLLESAHKAFECPVCCNVMHLPMLYHCGHSVCHRCMQSWDSERRATRLVGCCPLCRTVDDRHWKRRRLNHQYQTSVQALLPHDNNQAETAARTALSVASARMREATSGKTLHAISTQRRRELCRLIVAAALPLLQDAAYACKAHLRLPVTGDFADVQKVRRAVATELVRRQSVYRVLFNNNSWTVYFSCPGNGDSTCTHARDSTRDEIGTMDVYARPPGEHTRSNQGIRVMFHRQCSSSSDDSDTS